MSNFEIESKYQEYLVNCDTYFASQLFNILSSTSLKFQNNTSKSVSGKWYTSSQVISFIRTFLNIVFTCRRTENPCAINQIFDWESFRRSALDEIQILPVTYLCVLCTCRKKPWLELSDISEDDEPNSERD